MQINDILSKMNINISTNNAASVQNVEGVKNVAAEPQVQESNLYNLAEGEVFAGTVSEGENQKVMVTLSNGDTFTARPESGVELIKDQQAYFLVTSNDKGKMSIKLLTQNENASPTILKALGSAGYEVTDRAIDMVKSMMDKNLPLDPETVGNMVRNAAFFEGEPTDVLATLKKLGVSINDMNIEQLKAYDNGGGKLETPLGSITKELPEVIAKSGDARMAVQIAKALTEGGSEGVENIENNRTNELKQDIINDKDAVLNAKEFIDNNTKGDSAPTVNIDKLVSVIDREVTEIAKQEIANVAKETELLNQELNGSDVGNKVLSNGDNPLSQGISGDTAEVLLQNTKAVSDGNLPDAAKTGTAENVTSDGKSVNAEAVIENAKAENFEALLNAGKTDAMENVAGKEELLRAQQGENPIDAAKLQLVKDASGNTDGAYTKLLNELMNVLKDNAVPEEAVKKLFSSSSVKELLSKSMQEQWFMKPDEVENKEDIDKFYNKMNKQLAKIQEALNGSKNIPAELSKNVADIKNNLSFINEANHLYQYVQIPIKMASEHATGDLYVYTNKKNLRDPKQEITAHLHLEMEHLGTTDVDILLRQKKLTTHFMLADEDSLNLVLEHIDILTKRLSDKGFDVNIDASKMQEGEPENFLTKLMGMPLPKINYSKQSFDVKV